MDVNGGVPLLGAIAQDAREAGEKRAGLRCGGCGKRISQGWEFVRMLVQQGPKGPAVIAQRSYACNDEVNCGVFVAMAEQADAFRTIQWQFLDDASVREALGFEPLDVEGSVAPDGDAG